MIAGPAAGLIGRPNHRVVVFDSPETLAQAAAGLFVSACRRAVDDHGRFLVALAGGTTPRAMYRCLSEDDTRRAAVPWDVVHVFWGDERCVGPDHADSNFRMAREALLDHVPVPADQVYRMPADDPDPERAARNYAATLRRVFTLAAGEVPSFDLMVLGMGADGHTASLFPGVAAQADDRLVIAPFVEKLRAHRITLAPAVLTAARETAVLIAGAEKAATLAAALGGPHDPATLPIQRLRDSSGQVTWLVEAATARP